MIELQKPMSGRAASARPVAEFSATPEHQEAAPENLELSLGPTASGSRPLGLYRV